MMRSMRMRGKRVNGTLIPTLATMVVVVDRAEVDTALVALRLTAFT